VTDMSPEVTRDADNPASGIITKLREVTLRNNFWMKYHRLNWISGLTALEVCSARSSD
jgi:hypothetical protein